MGYTAISWLKSLYYWDIFLPLLGAGVALLAQRPTLVIQSQGSVCVGQEWRGRCVILAEWASLDSRHEVAEVQDFTAGIL